MYSKQKIQDLIALVENSGVTEIEIASFWGFKKIRISKTQSPSVPVQKIATGKVVESSPVIEPAEVPQPKTTLHEIKAPLVGTFYSASKPGDSPYIRAGDIVNPGQVVCIIEAMKIFNEIEADISGRITQILVQNEQPVEFDQPLFVVESL